MKRTLSVFAILAVGVLVAVAYSPHHPPAQPGDVTALKATIEEWTVPTKGAHPHDPAVGPDGSLWFTEQMTNKLGRLDPKTGQFKEYPLTESENPGPHGLVADRDGNIWFTANFGGYIGKLDPSTGKVTVFPMPDKKADDPHSLVFDSKGILWFTVQGGNMVGKLDPASGQVTLKQVSTENALPYGIQVLKRGFPVFCELGANKIGVVHPDTLNIQEYLLPAAVRPRRLAIAADDQTVYFTDFVGGNLGKLDVSAGAVTLYASPGGPHSNPYGIAITPDGMVWYSESGVKPNTIVRFDPQTQTFARIDIPSGGGVVRNMAATPDGRIYIACSGVDRVGVVVAAR